MALHHVGIKIFFQVAVTSEVLTNLLVSASNAAGQGFYLKYYPFLRPVILRHRCQSGYKTNCPKEMEK